MIDIINQPKVNIVLDSSKIDLFETCPARYNFRHNLNKTQSGVHKAKALDLGSLAHNGLEVYYKELALGTHFDDRLNKTLMKIRELSSDPDESSLEDEEIAPLLTAIDQSCDYWRSEDENCLEVLNVETPFMYELFSDDSVRILISGKIDLLVNYKPIGRGASYERLPIDHKTFSRDSMVLRKSNQFINYCNAVNSNYLVVNRIGLAKTTKAEEKFKRLPMSYDPIYIADWKENLTTMLMNEYLICVAEGKWPEKPTSCFKFNRICEYYSVCDSSGQNAKTFKLETNYTDAEIWDVTSGLKEE